MARHISDQEMERIREFANTPMYKREPEQLMPDSESSRQSDSADSRQARSADD